MILRFIYILLFFSFLQTPLLSQEGGGPPKKDQSIKSKRKQRKEDKKRWKEERRNKKAEEKKIREHHKRIQTKDVQKRMKRSKKVAQRNRDHKGTPWYEKLFVRKGKKAKASKEKSSKVKQN